MNWVEKIGEVLRELPPALKVAVMLAVDAVILVVVVVLARFLRIPDASWPENSTLHLYLFGPIASVAALALFGLYGTASRGHSMRIEQRIVIAQVIASVAWVVYLTYFDFKNVPRSIAGIYPALATVALVFLRRLAAKLLVPRKVVLPVRERVPVYIFGAGPEGLLLSESLANNGRYKPVAFLDTDYTLVGRALHGLKVHDVGDIEVISSKYPAKQVLIAKPELSQSGRRTLLDKFVKLGMSVKIVPDIADIAEGIISPKTIRNVEIEDLLGRDSVAPDRNLIQKAVSSKTVLVTGAGGSIGSELVRQCLLHGPKKIVLLDNSEFALFTIQREVELELKERTDIELEVVLGDVTDEPLVRSTLQTHRVNLIIHAAAYKHVRMVQDNPEIGIRNNVEGTRVLAQAAIDQGVEHFILVSTDKAVRPTSVMGASKRVAEMVVQAFASKLTHRTIFCMVRFGNVLGSTGSVVPIFKEQIDQGGPVTVTHPDVSRYFMLIPEAAQLVLQAGAIAKSGEVLVLDMGEPIRIVQLAETMIELTGNTVRSRENPNGDIEIKFTGLRDGEKMYEELEIGNDLTATQHARILRSKEFHLPYKDLARELTTLYRFMRLGQRQKAQAKLMELAFRDR